ncbi:MAG: hypothetical protein WD708_03005 [Kiritimatiellia bacterium]
MQTPLIAQSGLTYLIYLIVGIFWVVGNLMQQKEAKRKAAELRKRREEREEEERRTGKKSTPKERDPLERQLETFLGRLAGEPVKKSEPEPPPLPRKPQPEPIRFDSQPPPPPRPQPRKTKAATPPAPSAYSKVKELSEIQELKYKDSYKEIGEMKEAAELDPARLSGAIQSEVQDLNNVKAMMIDLSSTTFSMPILRIASMRTVRTQTSRPDLRKNKNFKRAVAAAVILEPPKALRENPFKETP